MRAALLNRRTAGSDHFARAGRGSGDFLPVDCGDGVQPARGRDQAVIGAEESHDEQRVSQEEMKAEGKPQKPPARWGSLGIFKRSDRLGRADQLVERPSEGLEPANRHLLAPIQQRLRELRVADLVAQPEIVARIENPFGQAQGGAITQISEVVLMGVAVEGVILLAHQYTSEDSDNDSNEPVGYGYVHLRSSLVKALLNRPSWELRDSAVCRSSS